MTRVPTTDCRTEAGAYFALGMVVLPHRPGTKQPWVRWKGYHTGDWLLDHAQVNQYWDGRFGDPGIMLVLGPASGVVAVDIDSEAAYQALISRLGEMTTTATVKSGNPDPYRMHLLFRIPEMLPKAAKLTPWHPNLEFRGQGGLVVLPPSIHPSGNRYQWCEGLSIWETGISELPSLIADEFRNRYLRSWTTNSPSELVIPVKELRASPELTSRERLHIHQLPYIGRNTKLFLLGCFVNGPAWNQRLFNAACDLQACGWSEELAVRLLLRGAQPWSNQETDAALTTIRSAFASERVRARVFRRPSPIQSR